MKMEIIVPKVVDLIKQIREQPESLFEMIRANVKETVGQYLSELMCMIGDDYYFMPF